MKNLNSNKKNLNSNKKNNKHVILDKEIVINSVDGIIIAKSKEPLSEEDVKKIENMLDNK